MKKNRLSSAIKSAIGVSTIATLIPTSHMAIAQEDEILEEVYVTGSRIKRSTYDEAAQVVTMDKAQIDAIGSLTIADVLRSSPLNSLGSFNERSGSSAQSNATVELRGLTEDRTLVMINGRRLPGSPNLGASAININMIPMAAVERIDILADGGSAVYGSDAVAGVVNMIMREKFEGIEFQLRGGDRTEDDGVEEGISLLTGVSGDKGNITFAAEWNRRDPIFDADRDYTAKWIRDNGDGRLDAYLDTDGISYYGKTIEIFDPNTGYYDLQAANNCPTTGGFTGPMGAAAFGEPDGSLCTYGYADIAANKAELNRLSTYLNANLEVSDKTEFFTTAIFSRVESFGRYAPPAASWNNMPADYADVPFDIDALLANGDITDDYELTGYYRWTNIGPRDNEVVDSQYDLVFGFRGDINDNISYETYAQKGRYEVKEFGYYYLSYPGLDYVLANDIDPFSEEGAAAMKATVSQDNFTDMSKIYGHAQFDVGDLFGTGEVTFLAGAEALKVRYQNKYDSASEAGLVGGSSGNSSEGDRHIRAVFGEAIIPVVENVTVNVALRYDDYSDFGNEVSPSISANWLATDTVELRARWSQGFRAPGLDQLYGPDTFSAEDATDLVNCANNGTAAEDCPERQIDTYYSTNDDLDAETSETFSLGGNWEFIDGWSIDIGYWDIEIENVIDQATTNDILRAEAAGVALSQSTGTYVDRSGAIPAVYSTYINEGTPLAVSGLDFKLNGEINTGFGTFFLGSLVTHTLKYEEAAYYEGGQQDVAGFNLYPDLKAQFAFGWTLDNHAVDLVIDYIGEHAEANDVVFDNGGTASLQASDDDLDNWTTVNLSYSYDTGVWGKIKIGARNLTNEDPVLDKNGKFARDHYDFYDNTGRVVYAEYAIKY